MTDTPRISLLMITYNQEKYIEEALRGALSQEYPDVEIVVCDDCSHDETFGIARRIVADYHGPHRVILHQNERNLGIGANFQQAYELASGDWLVMAAGDDISLPNRCQVIAEGAREYPQALAFATNYEVIDGDGARHGYSKEAQPMVVGAALCWHRRIFAEFPPMGAEAKTEDGTLLPRVFLLGGNLSSWYL